ncbi:D-glycero-alpha-D-manno-heptose-1,7-bisphosphate 7-phosphatase [Desulfurivibrio alkaliphilus]|uniref:D,D-heptose 1,7-bisphosphate phosphatase n=1 Tax=Desulfurivibrio alkaliphilus (strain DSM 19089 / UNIQEM U267 / AHT2) TaxID=589865 RepID=D6Z2M4_DESAT|nr:HAD family hydrolase [Desulfurivibrio alkaliphilus]ADH85799.1 D,D-heptose 1,7-bisphosphate phosphatase [Desulfurivibrio alkaliphilus AHT 2]
MSGRPALFLDRDGVINEDYAYVCRRQDFVFVEGIFELCRTARQRGYLLVVVTNQSGIGRGYFNETDFLALNDWMCRVFATEGCPIDAVYFCPYHPEHGQGEYKKDAACRKPQPGMIRQAAREHGIDLAGSVLVGDRESDIAAGLAAGIGRNILYDPAGSSSARPVKGASAVVQSLAAVQAYL